MQQTTDTARPAHIMRLILFVLGGATVGFVYYRVVGCRTGTCLLTGNPYVATLYGALIGFLLARG